MESAWLSGLILALSLGWASPAKKVSKFNSPASYLSDEYLEALQKGDIQWKAGRNFDKRFTELEIRRLVGVSSKLSRSFLDDDLERILSEPPKNKTFPAEFDARKQWPFCADVINRIVDTGFCASHYITAVIQAIEDRYCIHSGGNRTDRLSAGNVMRCCPNCGSRCLGGYAHQVWQHIQDHGVVTGGEFKSYEGCSPYPIYSPENYLHKNFIKCEPLKKSSVSDFYALGTNCTKTCENEEHTRAYAEEIHLVRDVRQISNSDDFTKQWTADFIKKELMTNGSVTTTVKISQDFLSYKSGIYAPSKISKPMEDVTVRIIGWGIENNLEYWLAANQWGPTFGDLGGFVKLRTGTSQLQTERRVFAGMPIL